MKAIVPVAGVGTRLRPQTHTVPKVLVPVAGKPILAHILDRLQPLGVDQVVLVVGYLGEKVVDYVRGRYRMRVHVVEQQERKGLGHAIHLTQDAVEAEEPVLIVLGDTIVEADLEPVVRGSRSAIGVRRVEDPRRFGIVEMEGDRVVRLVEKPDHPTSDLAVVGIYFLKNPGLLFRALDQVIREGRTVKGEFQLTDGLQLMVEAGEELTTFEVEAWHDCGSPDTLLETNRVLLEQSPQPDGRFSGSIIRPPVAISPGAQVRASIIGPYVSISAGARIEHSLISDSIISEGAQVEGVLLQHSLVGEHATVRGSETRLNIGDHSEIEIGHGSPHGAGKGW
ncbi:sugar nucleotidyltransferase [Limnochorda pilosa]|uniref:Nucleotidyl transferase n=1 Tax=Limnochorda pilosa TaxID=1555112 RepID=A0A0K2SP29_LIMPI|nr:sugar phosphate nucleotidyltransferase [Limnochorda pilosa]BAS28893.1 nucleotidyl transferase [Limnochorda pilosa]